MTNPAIPNPHPATYIRTKDRPKIAFDPAVHKIASPRSKRVDKPRTNEPGTCLFCGAKLQDPWRSGHFGRGNAFCTLDCGYRFGLACAASGVRLNVRAGIDPIKVSKAVRKLGDSLGGIAL